eukprot:scaffold52932_cov48-Phaeocystis_antarctica.AAC.3
MRSSTLTVLPGPADACSSCFSLDRCRLCSWRTLASCNISSFVKPAMGDCAKSRPPARTMPEAWLCDRASCELRARLSAMVG